MRGRERSGRKPAKGRPCEACRLFRIDPPAVAGDPTGDSRAEADSLCMVHRARAGEGSCVLCGRRLPWKYLLEGMGFAPCRSCFVEFFGERGARDLEEIWTRKQEGREEA